MIEYLPIVLTGVGIIVSILYYTNVLRNANKTQQLQLETRQAQLYMTLYNMFHTDDMWKKRLAIRQFDYNDPLEFMEKYGPETNPDAYQMLTQVWWTFGELGTLIYRNLITTEDVAHLISDAPVRLWKKWGPIIEYMRKEYWKNEIYYSTLEYLAKEMKLYFDSGVFEETLEVMKPYRDIPI